MQSISYDKSFHRFYEILRRHNYVTPTSYLELILTFKKLLGIKRDTIMLMRNRYVTGLEKLEFAASQVSVMQQELKDLQPELIKTSAETEKLMIKIEQDTVEVEAKKEVSCFTWELWWNIFVTGEKLCWVSQNSVLPSPLTRLNRIWHFMQIVFLEKIYMKCQNLLETIYMKSQILVFWEK